MTTITPRYTKNLTVPLRNRAAFMAIAGWLRDHISDCQQAAMRAERPTLMNPLLEAWHQARLPVLTLNYDTIIESSVRQCGLVRGNAQIGPRDVLAVPIRLARPSVGGLGGASTFFTSGLIDQTFRLHKLHGSLSWLYPGARGVGQPVFDIKYYGTWNSGMPDHRALARELPGTIAYIAPPTFAKDPYFDNELIRAIWERAGAALEQATHLYVVGYSLPSGDRTMRSLLQTRLPAETPITVIDSSTATFERIRDAFPTGERPVDHIGAEDPIRAFVDQLGRS